MPPPRRRKTKSPPRPTGRSANRRPCTAKARRRKSSDPCPKQVIPRGGSLVLFVYSFLKDSSRGHEASQSERGRPYQAAGQYYGRSPPGGSVHSGGEIVLQRGWFYGARST